MSKEEKQRGQLESGLFPVAFVVGEDLSLPGVDYTKEEVERFRTQLIWWIKESQPNEKDPVQKAEKVLQAALNGQTLSGKTWVGVERLSFNARVRSLCGWDFATGTGQSASINARRRHAGPRHPMKTAATKNRAATTAALHELSTAEALARRDAIKDQLIEQFPYLQNPVYESKVTALAEAEVRLESLSESFLTANVNELEKLLKVKEALRKDINELMMMLSIHPSQLKDRVNEVDRGDVGTLLVKFEELGEIAQEFETVDAIQELIVMVRQANNLRLDGSPQLADYLLWHKTGCAGHNFVCECGREWELYRGFTKEELEKAAEQAYEVFGYGLKKMTKSE